MEIIAYDPKYDNDIKDLLVELQQHITNCDKEGYNIITEEYREKYFQKTIHTMKMYNGIIYLAKQNDKVIGAIFGVINNEETKTYNFQAPKRGRIIEFVVSKQYQHLGIGKQLLNKIEEYFKKQGCKAVLLDVFGHNESAKKFYYNNGYFDRIIEVMKKLD